MLERTVTTARKLKCMLPKFAPSSPVKFLETHRMHTKCACRNMSINSAEHTRTVLCLHPRLCQKVLCVSSCTSNSLHPHRDVEAQAVRRRAALAEHPLHHPCTQRACALWTGLRRAVLDTICLEIAFCCNKLHHTKKFDDGAQWEI